MRLLTRLCDAIVYRLDWYWTGHADWMAFNFFLASLPIVLAIPLFRSGLPPRARGRRRLWFAGVAAFLLLLPYTPYVLTDVIHFHEAVHDAYSPARGVVEFAPLYAIYLALGFAMYAWVVHRAAPAIAAATGGRISSVVMRWFLHAVAILGIYVGRVTRLHAWHPFTDPTFTIDRLTTMVSPKMLLMIPATVALWAMTAGTVALARVSRDAVVRFGRTFEQAVGGVSAVEARAGCSGTAPSAAPSRRS